MTEARRHGGVASRSCTMKLGMASLLLLVGVMTMSSMNMILVDGFQLQPSSLLSFQSTRIATPSTSYSFGLHARHRKSINSLDLDSQQPLDLSKQPRPSQSSSPSSSSSSSSSTDNNQNDPEWKFFDTARIHVSGGEGGTGCVAFRREKGEARGGPFGGRGGNGGSIYLVCDSTLNTLAPLRQKVHIRSPKGLNGSGKNRDGVHGSDSYVRVPPGTIVRDLLTQKLAGELRNHGDELCVARGGRGGRGNAAFKTARVTAPKLAERGEPGAARWLSVELRLVADVGFLGMPNAGKSTLLACASAARPKIADYPFTTITPNLGVCDLDTGDADGGGSGLVLCDIPGLIQGAADGTGMGMTFLRHVQRCQVLLHVVDGSSEDPVGDFTTIQNELKNYDDVLANKPQVVVLNKMDISEVREQSDDLLAKLKHEAGHSRVLAISAATTERVIELMRRLKKFVQAQEKRVNDEGGYISPPAEIDLSIAALEMDSDDFTIMSDPAYPGQWRVNGGYIEQVAKMTHWEYPEAVARFGRQLVAVGISDELQRLGAKDGDLVMIDSYDFEFNTAMTNVYLPDDLLEDDMFYQDLRERDNNEAEAEAVLERKQQQQGSMSSSGSHNYENAAYEYMEDDIEELMGFNEDEEWDRLIDEQDGRERDGDDDDDDNDDINEDDFDFDSAFQPGDEVWTSSG
jgi:GTP-binding protein